MQGYSTQIPLTINYSEKDAFMDEVLREKIMEIVKELMQDDFYHLSELNKEFLRWVHSEYKDEIFCKYILKIICLFL